MMWGPNSRGPGEGEGTILHRWPLNHSLRYTEQYGHDSQSPAQSFSRAQGLKYQLPN